MSSSSYIHTIDPRCFPTTPITSPSEASTSGVKRIQRIKQRLSTKGHCVYPVIMVDLSSDDHIIPQKIAEDPYKGVSNNYLHHGDQVVVCDVCNAKLWKVEVGKGRVYLGRKSYMLCCGNGKVHLPNFKETYQEYQNLFKSLDDKSKHFLLNIRRFNSMFSFTSMGGKVDSKINRGNAPYVYRISGEDYHTLGSLLPKEGGEPKFAQLYIYDTDNEVCNRKTVFSNSKKPASATSDLLDTELIEYLKLILDSNNQLVKTYRRVRDRFVDNPHIDLKLRLKANRSRDGRTYNLPTSSEVAALIVGDIEDALDNRDVVVESKKDGLQRISELHPSYLALQYPLLFPFGEDGYRVDILHREGRESMKKKESKCTMREYFAYNVQDRVSHFSLILNARRFLQQFLVDVYTMIESERLLFIRLQQNNLRLEIYENLRKLGQNGNPDMSNVGTRVLLPSSFTGGSRYMRKNYYDAMAICKWFGYPDFFITITCNPKWPEIKIFLKNTNINPEDRPDILCRLFKIKLDAIMKDLQEKSLFGNALAVVYTIKFQKRGLPHAHICLFLNDESKLPSVEHVDNFISAEIPNKNLDPDLYTLVSDYMIHGPCGVAKPNCPCMVDGNCSKNFPKKFCDQTTLDSNGYPVYRRADSGFFVEKSGIQLDNRSVVPYSKTLLRRYQAHINVEWCNQAASIDVC
ncbi:putative helitron helicase-like domain-containing protein [Helianthus annuus]|nr:putative helitron helicase-like domain-containing protein [Helianthus annuus]